MTLRLTEQSSRRWAIIGCWIVLTLGLTAHRYRGGANYSRVQVELPRDSVTEDTKVYFESSFGSIELLRRLQNSGTTWIRTENRIGPVSAVVVMAGSGSESLGRVRVTCDGTGKDLVLAASPVGVEFATMEGARKYVLEEPISSYFTIAGKSLNWKGDNYLWVVPCLQAILGTVMLAYLCNILGWFRIVALLILLLATFIHSYFVVPFVVLAGYFLSARFVDWTWPKQESALPLALFRIVYGSVLFCEVCQLLYCEPLIFDRVPFLINNDMDLSFAMKVWAFALLLLIAGYQTRLVAIANYVMTLATFSVTSQFEYHIDYIYTSINLLLCFTPVSATLSLDNLRFSGRLISNATVSSFYRIVIVLFSLALVYMESCLWKCEQITWTSGLGIWRFASLPGFVWIDWSPFLQSETAAKAASHFTLAFEVVFLLVMWSRRGAKILCVSGVLLHVGILLTFPIPWFALACLSLYILVWPPSTRPVLVSPVVSQPAALPLEKRWGVALIAVMLSLQLSVAFTAKFSSKLLLTSMGKEGKGQITKFAQQFSQALLSRQIFGITSHTVFLDHHASEDLKQFLVEARLPDDTIVNLPPTTAAGLAHPHCSGRIWRDWSFGVSLELLTDGPKNGVERHLLFWAHRYKIPIEHAVFTISSRQTPALFDWKANHLAELRNTPWTPIWRVSKTDQDFDWSRPE